MLIFDNRAYLSLRDCFAGIMNCTMIQLENHLFVDGILNIRGNPLFHIDNYETGIVQPNDKSFVATVRPGAKLAFQILDEANRGILIRATLHIQGFLFAGGTNINLDRSDTVLMIDGPNAVFDVSNAIVRTTTNSLIHAMQGTICGSFGKIRLTIQNSNRSLFILSPSCNENDSFPSILFIQGNFSATLQTRIRNNACDRLLMTSVGQNSRSYNTTASVSSVILDEKFLPSVATWQVFEGTTDVADQNHTYGNEIQLKNLNSSKGSFRLGQYSNSSGVFIYKLCSPGEMVIGTECVPCKSGHFSTTGQPYSCKACAPGYFSAVAGSSTCKACLPGHVRNESMNADQCYPCPAGRSQISEKCDHLIMSLSSGFSSHNGMFCHECLPGLVSSENGSVCVPCLAGWIADESRTLCAPNT